MAANSETPSPGLEALLADVIIELEAEKRAELTPGEQRLDSVAREILRLQRDMTVPGTAASDSARLERLARFIEEREF